MQIAIVVRNARKEVCDKVACIELKIHCVFSVAFFGTSFKKYKLLVMFMSLRTTYLANGQPTTAAFITDDGGVELVLFAHRRGAPLPCHATHDIPTIITPTRIAWQEFTDT